MFVMFGLHGCGIPDKVDDVVQEATEVIDSAINDISNQSEIWQSVLQRVAADLPEEVSETIRNDAQNLATRSVATVGVEFRCNVDFFSNRAIASLKRLKNELLLKPAPILPPAFCQVSPDSIDLNSSPNKWNKITLQGYDLDHADANGNLLAFDLLGASGERKIPLPEEQVGRTTHYQVTISVGQLAEQLYTEDISKIVSRWESTEGNLPPGNLPEILVLDWTPKVKTETKNVDSTDYMPPKKNGDGNFNTHDDEHMSVEVQGKYTISNTEIVSQAYMHAREERKDWTEVDGWSNEYIAYQAPPGWHITSVRPGTNVDDNATSTVVSKHKANITEHNRQHYSQPDGEIVKSFDVWGDHDGDEAGTWTHVKVNWSPIEVSLRQIKPDWAS